MEQRAGDAYRFDPTYHKGASEERHVKVVEVVSVPLQQHTLDQTVLHVVSDSQPAIDFSDQGTVRV